MVSTLIPSYTYKIGLIFFKKNKKKKNHFDLRMKDSRVAFEDVRLFVLFFKTRNTTLALIFCSCGYDQRRDVMIFCSSTMF